MEEREGGRGCGVGGRGRFDMPYSWFTRSCQHNRRQEERESVGTRVGKERGRVQSLPGRSSQLISRSPVSVHEAALLISWATARNQKYQPQFQLNYQSSRAQNSSLCQQLVRSQKSLDAEKSRDKVSRDQPTEQNMTVSIAPAATPK